MAISIVINGIETPVTKQELFDMAKRGSISPDTEIIVNGTRSTAGRVQGIDFGNGASTHEKPDTRYEILLHNIPATVTRQQLFDLAAKGIINPDTPVTVNGKLGTAAMIDGIVCGIAVVDNAHQTATPQPATPQKSAPQPQPVAPQTDSTASTTKSRCISIGLLLMVLCAIVCFHGNYMERTNRLRGMGIDVGQSYSLDTIYACYSLGGLGFAVGFILFIVGLVLPGKGAATHHIEAEPLILGIPLTAKLTGMTCNFYVLDNFEIKPLTFTLDDYDASNRVRLCVKRGSLPGFDDYHYSSVGRKKQSIVIDKPTVGQYYIAVVGEYVPKPCNYMLLAKQGN